MAPLYLGDTAISKIYKGTTELAQNYLGDSAMLSTGPTGTDHFGIITYTGDRPTNAGKTGMGFQPDLVWIKVWVWVCVFAVKNDSLSPSSSNAGRLRKC